MKILHISYDYPDTIKRDKTNAVKLLIQALEAIAENYCISLNRVMSKKCEDVHYSEKMVALGSFGLPKGILFRSTIKRSIRRVEGLNLDFVSFNLVHAHKLTFEGPIAYHFYLKHGIPFLITIRFSDFDVIKVRPDMFNYYKKILAAAKKIIIISPWMRESLKHCLKEPFYDSIEGKIINIPNIFESTGTDEFLTSNISDKLVTVFKMTKKDFRRKNIIRVLKAINELKKEKVIIDLDIIGDGAAEAKLLNRIKCLKLTNQVKLLGKIDNSNIVNCLSRYRGFILCSYPETFGFVYLEALTAGLPIIYTKNTGIDGFFDHDNIGIKVRYNSIEEIKNAIKEVSFRNADFRENIRNLFRSDKMKQFSKGEIVDRYKNIILEIDCIA